MTIVAHFHSILNIDLATIKRANKTHLRIIDAIEKNNETLALDELEKDIHQVNLTYSRLNKSSKQTGQ